MSAGTFITLTTREARKAHALANQREVADLLAGQGLTLEVKNDGEHWIVREGRRLVVQWWPSTAKITPGETWRRSEKRGTVEEFVAFVGKTLRMEREHPPTVLPENREGLRVVKHRGQVAGYARNLGSTWEPLDARRRPLGAAVPKLADATRIICAAAAPPCLPPPRIEVEPGQPLATVVAPWDYSTAPDPATAVENMPTEAGRKLGALVAKLADEAEADQRRDFPNMLPRCNDCAFRAGTRPNGCEETLMDAIKCAVEARPFYCHKGTQDGAKAPSRLCSGAMVLYQGPTAERLRKAIALSGDPRIVEFVAQLRDVADGEAVLAAIESRGGARYVSELTPDERAAVTASQGSGFAPGSPLWSDPVTEYQHLCAELEALPSGDRTPEQDARVTEIVERCDVLWRGFSRSQERRAKLPLRKPVDPDAAALVDASLHPTGRCTCGDTGACAWCVETDRKLDEEPFADHGAETCPDCGAGPNEQHIGVCPQDEDPDGPVVCGGCYAVGVEPHAGYCIDERIRERAEEAERAGEDEP